MFVGIVIQEPAKEAEGGVFVEEFGVEEIVGGDEKRVRFIDEIRPGGGQVALENMERLLTREPSTNSSEGILS